MIMTIIRVKDTRNISGDNTILTGSDLGDKRALDTRDIGQALISPSNSTSEALLDGTSFVGSWVERITPSVLLSLATDQECQLIIETSTNAVDVDGSRTYDYSPSDYFPSQVVTIDRQYWRVRVVNTSGADQTFMRLQTSVGSFNDQTFTIGNDFDLITTTVISPTITNFIYSLGGVTVRTIQVTYTAADHVEITRVELQP